MLSTFKSKTYLICGLVIVMVSVIYIVSGYQEKQRSAVKSPVKVASDAHIIKTAVMPIDKKSACCKVSYSRAKTLKTTNAGAKISSP